MRKPSDLSRSGLTRIDTDAFMRAAAICSIVWNHANPSARGAFGGGMTFLMMLSGFNFARFSLQGGTPVSVRAALVRLGLRIGVPSFLLVLFFFAALHRFDAKELLFVSNWWTRDRIALFPLWYPEVMLQMFLLLYLMFLTPLGKVALSHMLAFSLGIFLLGAALRYALPFVWDTEYLNHDLPHLYLWNFTLGWVIFFLVVSRPPTVLTALLAIGCVALGSAVGWGIHRLDFWWLIVSGAIFVLFRTLLLPRIVAQVAGIISQAAFTVFLLHRFCFALIEHFVPAWKARAPIPHFLFALFASVGVWLLLVSTRRAYRALGGVGWRPSLPLAEWLRWPAAPAIDRVPGMGFSQAGRPQ